MPPITTVASGRCTSAPGPVASAIGTNPSEATRAVIKTGTEPRQRALLDSLKKRTAFVAQTLDEVDDDKAIEHCHAGQGDKADASADRHRNIAQQKRCHAAGQRKRNAAEDQCSVGSRPEAQEQQQEDQHQGDGNDNRQPPCCGHKLFELTAPADPVAGWEFDLLCDLTLRIGDKRSEIALSHIRGDNNAPLAILRGLIWLGPGATSISATEASGV